MPAASTKPDKASTEYVEPIKQVIQVVEKKVRNLEKRKVKLDAYKAKEDSGQVLEKDQAIAVARYEEVIQNLEFAKELQKQFQGISNDAEKMQKKLAKREKLEKQNFVLKRIQELFMIQNILDSMGSEKVRADFQSGKHGAVVLTEENLNHLDELYKLISPSREGEGKYQDQLTQCSDHMLALIDGRDKEVVGTTYKELKELIDLINNCGYFENVQALEEEEETSAKTGGEQEFVVVDTNEVPQPDSAEVQASLPPQILDEQQEQTSEASQSQQPEFGTPAEADSFFSKTAPVSEASMGVSVQQQHKQQHTQQQQQQHVQHQQQQQQQQQQLQQGDAYNQRPFQDIVSSVQGNFNFLQESTIDMESPHMDPAVVAAHPMPSVPHGHGTESSNLSQTFTNPGFTDLQQQSLQDSNPTNTASDLSQSSLLPQQQQSVSALTGSQDYSSQSFGQTSMSQSLQSDSLFQSSSVEDSTSQLTQGVLGQTSDSTISQFEMPPPAIPMPPGHESNVQESSASDQSQAEKKLNPNAEMFQSQLYGQQQNSDYYQQQGEFNRGFQGNNYNSGYRGNRGGGGGGFRGKNNRGGGMSNGFNNDRRGRGGNYGGNSGGNRGGFQNFPQRNDYRSEGYNSYNGNNFGNNSNNNGFQKRGGGPPRGGNRGGSGGMRGGSGGQSRGGPRGSGRGGTNQGGFGRPNMSAQQTA